MCKIQGLESCFVCLFVFYPHLRTFFSLLLERGRERGRERGKYWCKREALISCLPYMPRLRIIPTTRYEPWPVIEPATFRLRDDTPTNQATLARAGIMFNVSLSYSSPHPHSQYCQFYLKYIWSLSTSQICSSLLLLDYSKLLLIHMHRFNCFFLKKNKGFIF